MSENVCNVYYKLRFIGNVRFMVFWFHVTARDLRCKFRVLLGVEETESVHSETSGGNIGPLSPYHRRRQSSNVSDGSKGSTGSTGKMTRTIAAAPFTLAKLRKDTENVDDLKFNYLNK